MSAIKTSSSALLTVQNLQIGYSQKTVASHINLELQPGELTAVIGINGSGKSTFLKTITGELSPQHGAIYIKNKKLSSLRFSEIAEHISIVLSKPVYAQNLSVEEVVALGRHPYTNWLGKLSAIDRLAIGRAITQVGIRELRKHTCDELSDGQLQKVFIARALAQDTEMIILDEPTNHLDLYHKAYVFKMLKKLTQETRKTVILATHELNLALQLCDQLVLIKQGEVFAGGPEQLIDSGILSKLFPSDLIGFDKISRSFRVKE